MSKRNKPLQLVLGVNGFSLPIEAVTESIGILAKRRAGKSTTARRLAEQFAYAKQQVVIVDPKGDWWGLLYRRDGKRPGLPIIVLGGGHGHVPLELNAGEVVARLVVMERVSIVLDLSHFRRDDVPTFMTPFLETLYRLKADERYRTAMTLIIDEADTIAPQTADRKGERLMASAVEDIVRRGGQRGIGCVMITQRTAELSKSALTQIGILIVLRTIAPQDLKAMDAWIAVHGTATERIAVRESLPTMAQGEAFVWAPGWPSGRGIFERVQMQLPDTFDSSSTPTSKRGRAPKHPARVDLGALEVRMAATLAHVKANDPAALKQSVAAQRADMLALQRKFAAVVAERDQLAQAVKGREAKAQIRRIERALSSVMRFHARVVDAVAKLQALGASDRAAWSSIFASTDAYFERLRQVDLRFRQGTQWAVPTPPVAVPPANKSPTRPPVRDVVATAAPRASADASPIGKGEREILRAAVALGETSRVHLSLHTGYKRSTRDAYLQRLVARGLVSVADDRVTALPAGIGVAGPVERPPERPELLAWWRARLPAGEAVLLGLIAGGTRTRDALTEASGFKQSTRNAYLQRLAARELILVDPDDTIRPYPSLT